MRKLKGNLGSLFRLSLAPLTHANLSGAKGLEKFAHIKTVYQV